MSPVSAQFSVTVRVELDARNEPLGKLTAAIAESGGGLQSVDLVPGAGAEGKRVREFTIDARGPEHWEQILRSIGSIRGARVIDYTDRTFEMHAAARSSSTTSTRLKTRDDLSMAYTPGVAARLHRDRRRPCQGFRLPRSRRTPSRSSPTAAPSSASATSARGGDARSWRARRCCSRSSRRSMPSRSRSTPTDPDKIVEAVKLIAPGLRRHQPRGHLRPRCFEIEDRLRSEIDIPVFHDDQHGTAVVVMAALFNSLKIVGKPIESLRVVMLGLGAAGIACTKMMLNAGVTDIIGCDRRGAISTARDDYASDGMPAIKRWFAETTNPDRVQGGPNEVLEGADLFIGLSGPGLVDGESLAGMSRDAIVFAMANPTPEVMPEDAERHVRIMATGRSDYPNQINNVLCFPGIFRGALDAGAPAITEEMKLAAAKGIAAVVTDEDLNEDYIIPSVFDRDVAPAVAAAVVAEAKAAGIARVTEETGTFAAIG
jgi:malate dehydrogenase (oxaloacetate-decarboxylating)